MASGEWFLTPGQQCDLEMIMNGGFAPLKGFMRRKDVESVKREMRLTDGTLWPLPVTLDVPILFNTDSVVLKDQEGYSVAKLNIEDVWSGRDCLHVGGDIEPIRMPTHHYFKDLRLSPLEVRQAIKSLGWKRIAGFHTRNPMHIGHYAITHKAMQDYNVHLLIHPTVASRPRDIDPETRVKSYRAIMPRYWGSAILAVVPLDMRMAGPREAVLHAIVRKNYGCTHFIVGRDHAGNGNGMYEAQELAMKHSDEIGIEIIPASSVEGISGTEVRLRLEKNADLDGLVFPEVAQTLKGCLPTGFTVFIVGPPGSGKSTVAHMLAQRLGRKVTILDGDIIRRGLSSDLNHSKEDRELQVKRISFMASEVNKHGGTAICAVVAADDYMRKDARDTIKNFIMVYLPKARNVKGFDIPYDPPKDAEVVTSPDMSPHECVDRIVVYLRNNRMI